MSFDEIVAFSRSTGQRLEVSHAAVEAMKSHRQMDPHAPEAGGILLGRELLDGNAVVDLALGPNPSDKRSRFRFHRNRKDAQTQIDAHWTSSGGVADYLGEWHTHPEDMPTPSAVDIWNWMSIACKVTPSRRLIFLIIGRIDIACWEVTNWHSVPQKLRQV